MIVKPGLDCCARGFLVLYAVVGLLLLRLLLLRVLLTAAEPLSLTHERCVGQSWTNRQTSLRLDWHCPQFSKHQHLSTLPWNETTDGKSNNLHLWTDFLKTRRTKKRELIHCKQHCRWPKGRHTTDHGDWFLPRPTDTFTLDRVVNYNLFSISEQVSFGWFWQITFVGSKMSGCRALARSFLYLGLVSQKATTVWVGWRAEYFVHSAIVLKNTFPLACWILCTLCVCRKILLG